jgi:nickel-dependent lactate racemase
MDIQLKYGEGTIEIQIPDSVDVTVLEPKKHETISSVERSLKKALVQAGELHADILPSAKENQTVAIAIPDETRPLPISEILPHLLDWLFEKNPTLNPEQVYIVIGSGLHASNEIETIENLVPNDLPEGCRIIVHDALRSPTDYFGDTEKGTPVLINDAFAKADYKIVVGQIDPHQIVGFTDSVSGLITGCSGEATLEHNHSLMFDDAAKVGILDGNPVREDMNEAATIVGIDLAVDFVLSPNKEIVKVIAGRHIDTLYE